MSDLFIGFVRCFLTFRRVVKERENAVKVVLHCELFLPVSSVPDWNEIKIRQYVLLRAPQG